MEIYYKLIDFNSVQNKLYIARTAITNIHMISLVQTVPFTPVALIYMLIELLSPLKCDSLNQ